MTIWTPSNTRKRLSLPSGDVRLADGRLLKRIKAFDGGPFSQGGCYKTANGMRVIASIDDTPNHGVLLHVSVSYQKIDPSWSDIRAVKDAFFGPDVDVMMVLPKEKDYVNVHEHTFHLWQTPTEWGLM